MKRLFKDLFDRQGFQDDGAFDWEIIIKQKEQNQANNLTNNNNNNNNNGLSYVPPPPSQPLITGIDGGVNGQNNHIPNLGLNNNNNSKNDDDANNHTGIPNNNNNINDNNELQPQSLPGPSAVTVAGKEKINLLALIDKRSDTKTDTAKSSQIRKKIASSASSTSKSVTGGKSVT